MDENHIEEKSYPSHKETYTLIFFLFNALNVFKIRKHVRHGSVKFFKHFNSHEPLVNSTTKMMIDLSDGVKLFFFLNIFKYCFLFFLES